MIHRFQLVEVQYYVNYTHYNEEHVMRLTIKIRQTCILLVIICAKAVP